MAKTLRKRGFVQLRQRPVTSVTPPGMLIIPKRGPKPLTGPNPGP